MRKIWELPHECHQAEGGLSITAVDTGPPPILGSCSCFPVCGINLSDFPVLAACCILHPKSGSSKLSPALKSETVIASDLLPIPFSDLACYPNGGIAGKAPENLAETNG